MIPIRLDKSPCSVVIVCPCGWRDIVTARGPALTAAADHVDAVHAEHRQAAKLRARRAVLNPR